MLVGVVKLAPSLPLDGNYPYLHLDQKIMHLGFHIYDVGFQSPNVEAARPLVYATALLLVLNQLFSKDKRWTFKTVINFLEMNGRTFTFDEMAGELGDWWFPTDSAVLSGDIDVAAGGEHEVAVDLSLYIPYIIIGEDDVLRIAEHDEKTMEAVQA